ncbi:MAG TPA: FxsA family protein [Phycisphaerae bacterium]|nr:FxsA family protein [Phycisphaerae bacterium]HRY66982.1 FxsA family protein [Phycisphaerae bacterium]HSA28821.1 FxsA family protein [Phycisphaerae bacterium]
MVLRLLLLFTLVPLVELAILIKIGSRIGAGTTIVMVLLIGFVGAAVARHEGWRTIQGIQADMAAGRLPGDRLVDGLLILIGGILLITPGVLTDIAGLLLFLPPVRALVRTYMKRRLRTRITLLTPESFGPQRDDDFIDVEARPAGTPDGEPRAR